MPLFDPGERVYLHPYGFGTVKTLYERNPLMYEVVFDGRQYPLLIQNPDLESAEQLIARTHTSSWFETFLFEDEVEDARRHDSWSQWAPLFDHEDEVRELIPPLVQEGYTSFQGYGDVVPAPRLRPDDWTTGRYLVWPQLYDSVVGVVRTDLDPAALVMLFPFLSTRTEHAVQVERVRVWSDGVIAQIEGGLGDAEIAFFDPHYLDDRLWYEQGGVYKFALAGLAYAAGYPEVWELAVELKPEIRAALQAAREHENRDMPAPKRDKLSLEGAAIFFKLPDGDIDDYRFHGPIKDVDEFELLGRHAWRLTVTVMRTAGDEEDVDLDIVVTDKAWEEPEPPRIGRDIEGALWLQGSLVKPLKTYAGAEVSK